ncbi:MAG: DNA polymerase I [Rickettsiales bacterium]|nr:DNA polymerase I [Rickettsiales bacterium]|tara:strand:- start:6750 stop:9464 length:2715 start_codon:yes stop_codon:yes gene_type:complete
MDNPSKTLFLIDGSGFIFRAYYALPPLTRPDGTPISAVLGFTNMILNLMENLCAHHIAVVFDSKRKNFRHDIYPAYKANRAEAPEDLVPQFPLMREACNAFQIPVLEKEGFEADDLIAAYTKKAIQEGYEVTIISSDKDLMQLVSDKVVMYDHMKNTYIRPPQVLDKFSVTPEKVRDVLALAGDSSDNVPGVPGIGPKTAATLINEYGSFDSLFENLHQIKQPKRREALEQNHELAKISRDLVSLCTDIDNLTNIESLVQGSLDDQQLTEFLDTQGFKSIKSRLQINSCSTIANSQTTIETNYTGLTTQADLQSWAEKIQKTGYVAFDTETTGLSVHTDELVGISLALSPGEAAYIPLQHKQKNSLLEQGQNTSQLDIQTVSSILKPLFEDPSILKIAHNAKFDAHVLRKVGINVSPVDDTLIMAALIESGGKSLDELVQQHFSHTMISFKDLVGKGMAETFAEVPISDAISYAAEDADYTLRLWLHYQKQFLSKQLFTPYYTVDRPMISILSQMEERGVLIDQPFLTKLGQEFDQQINALEQKVFSQVSAPFNLGSPKQLGIVLFEELGLPGGKKGKSGSYATGADVLEKLSFEGHEIVKDIIEWRQFSKLKSTYIDGLLRECNPQTGRVHTNYTLSATSTGRLSSTNPNLQNIPIRTEVGRQIRQAFIPVPGYTLISLDYSQIELRLLAHMANIPVLQQAFINHQDIHRLTASQVFNISYEEITKEQRRQAKAINFGIIYGISGYGLARQLDISVSDANDYIKRYKEQYPGITRYMEKTIDFARQHGFVKTLFDRPCYVPNINAKNPMLKNYAERQAINAPLQGSNADIIKRAMAKIPTMIEKKNFDAHMLLQVHDELIFEVRPDHAEEFIQTTKKLMEQQAHLSVPLVVDAGTGKNWAEAH